MRAQQRIDLVAQRRIIAAGAREESGARSFWQLQRFGEKLFQSQPTFALHRCISRRQSSRLTMNILRPMVAKAAMPAGSEEAAGRLQAVLEVHEAAQMRISSCCLDVLNSEV
jgi:hypothetical protein